MSAAFDYKEAFSRNLGWVTAEEQQHLRRARIAIGGAGGVGGIHLITLVRLGITNFHLADPDVFEMKNFNRQYGADMTSLGLSKCEVMLKRALEINPEVNAKLFPKGITKDNLGEFLDGIDIYIDGLDIFAMGVREFIFPECKKRSIPCLSVAPIGMGASIMCFTEESISFENYFGTTGKSPIEKTVRFILGMAPSLVHKKSLVAKEYSNLHQQRAASTPMGCALASGMMGTEVLKLILKRGPIVTAPTVVHYDGYSYKLKKTTLWLGYRNPIFQLKLWIMIYILKRIGQ